MPETCTHYAKARHCGGDARLYSCRTAAGYVPPIDRWDGSGPTPFGDGCGALFVDGNTWEGEPHMIEVPQPVACDWCIDGLGLDKRYPTCERCGTPNRRPLVAAPTKES